MTIRIARETRIGNQTIGLAALAAAAYAQQDLNPLWQELALRVQADPGDAGALMDLARIAQLTGNRDQGLALQRAALEVSPFYWQEFPGHAPGPLRLLAFAAPGDFMANTPLDFLLEGSGVSLQTVYLAADRPLPVEFPDHDLAFVAIGESDPNRPALRRLRDLLPHWPRPVVNPPEQIAALSRDGVYRLLGGLPGMLVPRVLRVPRPILAQVAIAQGRLPGDLAYPVILRPIASHAGQGLEKIEEAAELLKYLELRAEEEFYLSPFIDYSNADGLFRKYRIAVIDGRPHLAHLAISEHWMVHYLSAGMQENVVKRAEEAACMACFDQDFGHRHSAAFAAMTGALGLDYYAIDCAETADGRLLLFEADVAMIVHAMDPPDLFPYKRPAMRRIFGDFAAMLRDRARLAPLAQSALG